VVNAFYELLSKDFAVVEKSLGEIFQVSLVRGTVISE